MTDFLGWVSEHQVFFQVLGLTSFALLLASVVIFPLVVAHLPRDYFVRNRRDPTRRTRRRPMLWVLLTVVKNLTGLVLILAGVAMLVLPGQGILTILMGLALTNFPGKYRLERWLVQRPAVGRGLNRIRKLAGKEGLEVPSDEG